MKYVLIDSLNMFFRMKHTSYHGATMTDKLGLCLHMILASANKVARDHGADHVIFFLEGESNWRKSVYPPYKKQRAIERQKRTESEVEEDELMFEVFSNFINYIDSKTNCTVLKSSIAEADDVIARWIHLHPNDDHVIVSSDSDFHQLVSKNVHHYNGMTKEFTTLEGVIDDNGNPVINKKTNEQKSIGDPEYLLFEKCIRGDKSDNVFSAYPGVRAKGTKNKIGIIEAFNDRHNKGFNWNNFMMQRWVDHEGEEHKVLDDYNRNRTLIDLSAQPEHVVEQIDRDIISAMTYTKTPLPVKQVSFGFMKFCGEYDLQNMSKQTNIITWLSKSYEGELCSMQNQ